MQWRSEPGLWIAALLVGLRLLVIDMDPPVLPITYHLAKDESFYAALAHDLHDHGRVFPDGPKGLFGIPMVTNAVTFAGLSLFGDGHLGLRIGSILFGLLSLFVFQLILRKITTDRLLLNVLPLALVIDIQFTFATIVVEPTITRIAVTLLTMLWLINRPDRISLLRWSLIGFGLTFSVVITYPSNGFILFAVPLVHLWSFFAGRAGAGWKSLLLPMVLYGVGVLVAVITYFAVPPLFSIDEYAFMFKRGDEYTTRVGLTLGDMLKNVLTIPSGGIFRFHPAMLLLLASSLVLVPMRRFQAWNRTVAVVYLFCVAFLAQTIFLNDFPLRKLTFLLPFVLLLGAALQEHWRTDTSSGLAGWLQRNRFALLGALAAGVVIQAVFYYRLSTSETPLVLQSSFAGFFCLAVVIMGCLAVWKGWLSGKGWRMVMVVALLLPGAVNTIFHVLVRRTYFHRDFMVGLERFGDTRFVGGWSMGFRLYNTIDAVVNPYQYRGAPIQVWDVVRDVAKADPRVNYSIGIEEDRPYYEERGFTEHERVDMRYPDGTVESYIIFVEPS